MLGAYKYILLYSILQVLDPFCGTGGILLAAAALGANPLTSLGCDIDPLVSVEKGWQRETERQLEYSCLVFVCYTSNSFIPSACICIFRLTVLTSISVLSIKPQ